jgi:hypothetical protein
VRYIGMSTLSAEEGKRMSVARIRICSNATKDIRNH